MTPASDHSPSAPRLPDGLEPLERLARNLAWTLGRRDRGRARARSTRRASPLPPAIPWRCSPPSPPARLETWLPMRGSASGWPRRRTPEQAPGRRRLVRDAARAPGAIAYFSPEFGLSEALPQYSGGLGILAGDHLKAASDLGVPIVGIGLFYRNGYFRQLLTAGGAQQEEFVELDPDAAAHDAGARRRRRAVLISVPLPARRCTPRLWRVDVGRVQLLPARHGRRANAPAERAVTDRLYGGDSEHRLRQEILLGIGGVKALAACGIEPAGVPHERGPRRLPRPGARARRSSRTGLDARARPASRPRAHRLHDAYAGAGRHRPLLARPHGALLRRGRRATGLPLERLLALGAEAGGDAARLQHGGTRHPHGRARQRRQQAARQRRARDVRAALPGHRARRVPITHVTNGVHAETWVGPEFGALYRARLGDGYGARSRGLGPPRLDLATRSCSSARADARLRLVDEVRRRLARQAARARRRSGRECVAGRRARPAGAHARVRTARADVQAARRCCCTSANG